MEGSSGDIGDQALLQELRATTLDSFEGQAEGLNKTLCLIGSQWRLCSSGEAWVDRGRLKMSLAASFIITWSQSSI